MIGTHDSFTGLTPRYKIFNLFSWLWRTQVYTPTEQYAMGVRYFDVRVRFDKYNNLIFCHGYVDFNKDEANEQWKFLLSKDDIFIRLILERGSGEEDEELFRYVFDTMSNLSYSAIKKNWKILYDDDPSIKDYSYIPWLSGESFWTNIKNMNFFSTIKKWAKKHNPVITDDIKNDNEVVYFMDYFHIYL